MNIKLSAALLATFVLPKAFAMSDVDLAKAMRADINKYLVTVKSPRLIFHWVDSSDINPPGQYNTKYPANAPHYRAYVEKQGRKILNKRNPRDPDIAGPGLYMASDALVSRQYGGKKSFGLVVGLLKPGAKLFTQIWPRAIDSNLVAEIRNRGCSQSDYTAILDTAEANCTKIKQLLVGNDISFASGRIYGWVNAQHQLGCAFNNRREIPSMTNGDRLDTFVAYNSNLFSNVYGFTHKSTLSGDPLADQILSYVKGLSLSNYANMISQDQMQDQSIKAMNSNEIANFSKKYVFGCN